MAQSNLEIAKLALLKLGEDTITALADSNVRAQTATLMLEPAKRAVLRLHPWNFAIKRTILALKTVTNCANNGSGLIRVTVTSHGWSTGNNVTISEVLGTSEANGTWDITVINANTFDLVGSAFSNTYTSGGKAGLAPEHGFSYAHSLPSDFLRLLDSDGAFSDASYRVEAGKLLTDNDAPEITYIYDVTDYTTMDTMFYDALSTYLAWMMCQKLTENGKDKEMLWQDFERILAKARFVDGTEDSIRQIEASEWLTSRFGYTGNRIR